MSTHALEADAAAHPTAALVITLPLAAPKVAAQVAQALANSEDTWVPAVPWGQAVQRTVPEGNLHVETTADAPPTYERRRVVARLEDDVGAAWELVETETVNAAALPPVLVCAPEARFLHRTTFSHGAFTATLVLAYEGVDTNAASARLESGDLSGLALTLSAPGPVDGRLLASARLKLAEFAATAACPAFE